MAILLYAVQASAACTQSGTTQDCTYEISWTWSQGAGDPATGFIVQRQMDDNGVWLDVAPVPVTQKIFTDTIKGDKGGRKIAWRVLAYDGINRSGPSNTASITTPLIAVVAGPCEQLGATVPCIELESQGGLVPQVKRRSTNRSKNVWIEGPKDMKAYVDGKESP